MLRSARCWPYVVLFAFLHPSLPAAEPGGYWPQWRGPNRDNISADTKLLQTWPEGGPPLRWSVEGVGNGTAAVAVADGRVYTVGYIGDHEFVTALAERSGERLWAASIGPAMGEAPLMRWLSQRTPTIDADRLYVIRADGQLVCLSTADGQELWRKDYAREFGPGQFPNNYGYCDYPLVDGERLICAPGSKRAALVALNKLTGDVIWRISSDITSYLSYGAIVAVEWGGVRQYIGSFHACAFSVAADSGNVLWLHRSSTSGGLGTLTPIVIGERVLCPNAYGRHLMLLEQPPDSEPGLVREVYSQSISTDLFIDHGFVVGDHAYLSARRGGALLVVDWKTGDVTRRIELGEGGGAGRFGMTYADGRVYSLSATGGVTLAEISADGYLKSGNFELPRHEQSAGATLPVVTGGRLYLRSEGCLFCYDVRLNAESGSKGQPVAIVLSPPPAEEASPNEQRRVPRPIFVPTPQDVVDRMLELAKVEKEDKVVDLGSGDGRIVITAAKTYGCRAVGYEIDQELVKVSQQQIAAEKLSNLAEIKAEDMYTADLSDVQVVAVYVYPSVLDKMKPQFAKLPAGARIVSHQFEIPGVTPSQTVEIESEETGGRHTIYVYTAPLTVSEETQ